MDGDKTLRDPNDPRQRALEQAVTFACATAPQLRSTPEQVVAAAEAFRAFLDPPPPEPETTAPE